MGFGSGGLGSSGGGNLQPFVAPPEAIVYDIWPSTLPQFVLQDGYREAPSDIVKRTLMEVGPPKQRPLFTRGFKKLPVQLSMDLDQVAIFKAFYQDTLLGGTIPFQWVHPRTQEVKTFRANVMEEHSINGDAGRNYKVALVLEVLT